MVWVILPFSMPAFAQASPSEHAKHHPSQAQASNQESNQKGPPKDAGGMMGGAGGMDGMMEKMGAPKPKQLYPKLMNLPYLPMEERTEIKLEARLRMEEGLRLLSEGRNALALASEVEDFSGMQASTLKMREGLARYQSGLAAYRALEEGKAPRNVALQWFKREMNLLPRARVGSKLRLFGMSSFHASVMALLIAFAFAMIWMYFLKMRRATMLIQELLTAGQNATQDQPSPALRKPAAAQVESTNKKVAVPEKTSAAGDCCEGSTVDCATEETKIGLEQVSPGLLPVVKRKLCRLRVAHITQETEDVKTFRFVTCHGGGIPFSYFPGQFLTLTLPVNDKPIRRSYTISSSPTQGFYCEITVKREDKGAGSRFLHDTIKVGDTLEVQAPNGKFVFTGKEAETVVLIAGGVGITPMMSIVRALTDMGWRGDIYFLAACRDPDHFIFQAEIKRLECQHSNLHVFVAASRMEALREGYHQGRLSQDLLAKWVPDLASKWIHLCGAPPMMDGTKTMLLGLGVPPGNIHLENFGSQQKPRKKPKPSQVANKLAGNLGGSVTFSLSQKSTHFLPDETILEASERVGADIDYSCRTGMCGVCQVKLLSGEVAMEVDDGLEADDKRAGMILACQAKSTGDVSVEH